MNGFILLDKPYNWSSNFVLYNLKNIFYFKKIGYSGTLDKLSTGILPILINDYTKYSNYFINLDRYYDVIIYLGISTDSYDGDCKKNKIFSFKLNINKKKVTNIINSFIGNNIKQIIPIYSNYKYFKKINRDTNKVKISILKFINIYNINILYFKENFLRLLIHCSKGTYIRSIVDSIGYKLKCGAYVFYLRRIRISNYFDKNLLNFNIIYKNIKKSNNIKNLLNKYILKFKL